MAFMCQARNYVLCVLNLKNLAISRAPSREPSDEEVSHPIGQLAQPLNPEPEGLWKLSLGSP